MNRRRFIQSLVAVFTLPSGSILSIQTTSAALPAAATVPTQARFWAIYMSGLHGECTPQTLQNLLHIPEVDAKRYISQLIADEVIKPAPLLQKSVSAILNRKENSLLENVKKRLEMKSQAVAKEPETREVLDVTERLDLEPELPADDCEEISKDLEVEDEDRAIVVQQQLL